MNEDKNQLGCNQPQLLPSKSLLTTVKLGYDEENIDTGFNLPPENPVKDIVINTIVIPQKDINCKNPDSIIENIDTGFGCINKLVKELPKFKTHLCKENYLGEFESETEKTLARNNLEVYSKNEIDKVISQIIESNKNFTTKKEVESMIAEIDVVNSTVKSYADYQIPNNLFQL